MCYVSDFYAELFLVLLGGEGTANLTSFHKSLLTTNISTSVLKLFRKQCYVEKLKERYYMTAHEFLPTIVIKYYKSSNIITCTNNLLSRRRGMFEHIIGT